MNKAKPKILLIDDDQDLCELLASFLKTQEIASDCAFNAEQALAKLDQSAFDLLVMDIMMPVMDGLELLKLVRQKQTTPVIMLTGKGDDIDRIIGLELGADDYMAKPCNPRELSARIKAILRRVQNPQPKEQNKSLIQIAGFSLKPQTLELRHLADDQLIELTGVEFQILYLLAEHAGQTVSKEQISLSVLNRKLDLYDRSIDVHISRIRNKLNPYLGESNPIKTIRGAGYQLILEAVQDE